MADGDAAALAGLATVPATAEVRDGHHHHNQTRDMLADHQTDGTHPWSKITGKPPVEADIDALETLVTDLQNAASSLLDNLADLEARVAILEGA